MQESDMLSVTWAFMKVQFAVKPFRMSYTQINGSYQVYIVAMNFGMTSLLVDSSDITDFTNNYQPTSTAVASASEAIALSLLPEASKSPLSSADSGRSFGYVATSAAASVPVRASVYTPPGNNAQRSVKSTSANDSAAGTGARKVKITYLDAACNGPFTETVTLNGVTGVDTVATNIALIEKIEVVEVGSLGGNAGSIQLMTAVAGGGSVIGSINVGDNQTYWAHHYVPAGKKCGIADISVGSQTVVGGTTPNVLNPINSLIPQRALDATTRHIAPTLYKPYAVPLLVEGPAIVFLNERPDAATASTTFAGFAWVQF